MPKSEIKSRKLSQLSMMPEGLVDTFPNQDIRDLIGYLRGARAGGTPSRGGCHVNG